MQENLHQTTAQWVVDNFDVDLVTQKTLNIRNLSSTVVLKIRIEYNH